MRNYASLMALLALGSFDLLAQAEPAPNPQRLVFVGDPKAPRTEAYVTFLRRRFAAVEVTALDAGDATKLQADVVLLDWPQGENPRARRAARWSPLGERAQWRTPTVLLGSAGHNLAGSWQTRGGFG